MICPLLCRINIRSDIIFSIRLLSKHFARRQSKYTAFLQPMHVEYLYMLLNREKTNRVKLSPESSRSNVCTQTCAPPDTHDAGLCGHNVYKCSSQVPTHTGVIMHKQNSSLQGYSTDITHMHAHTKMHAWKLHGEPMVHVVQIHTIKSLHSLK